MRGPGPGRLFPGLAGVPPGRRRTEVVAGLALAAVAVPEALGYARIAGMPVQAGLYTLLLPVAVFALAGASRHLAVGADSATAAILGAGLAPMAVPGSGRFVALAATTALLVAGILALARVVGLGFLAHFLSGSVLVGFLTGVGLRVVVGQVPDLLGLPRGPHGPADLLDLLAGVPLVIWAVSAAALALPAGIRRFAPGVPAVLVTVVVAIAASRVLGLSDRGVPVLGPVPAGLPVPTPVGITGADLGALLPLALSLVAVVLSQSAATARAYAVRHDERADTDRDLAGLAAANLGAALTGGFVVNGSATRTQVVDDAGARSQWAQLASVAGVVAVLLFATGPLAALPVPVLAAVVTMIGVELVDRRGMRRLWDQRRAECGVAVLTAAAVAVLGAGTGIAVAVVASLVDHLRHSYAPRNAVLRRSPAGHWRSEPVVPGARTVPGLVVYRFGTGLYFANAFRLGEDVDTLLAAGDPVDWFCLDAAAVGDVDNTAGSELERLGGRLRAAGVRLVFAGPTGPVRDQLRRLGWDVASSCFDTAGEVLEAFLASRPPPEPG